MRHAGRQLRELVEATAGWSALMDEGVVVADGHGTIRHVNEAAAELVGWPAAELVGRDVAVLVPERLRPAHERAFQRHVATGERRIVGRPVRLPALRRDGTEADLDVVLSSGRTDDGAVVIATLRPAVQDERSAEAALARQLLDVLSERLGRDEMLPRILGAIGEALSWDVGNMWVRDPAGDQLRLEAHWSRVPADRFAARSSASLFPAGVGLPGRVWQSNRLEFVEQLERDPNFVRRDAAVAAGLRSGLAFPLSSGGRFRGVVELFSREPRTTTPDLLRLLAGLGEMLGAFLDRSQVEEERHRLLAQVQTERAQLEAVVRQLPQGVVITDADTRVVITNAAADRLVGPHTPGEHVVLVRPNGVAYQPDELPLASCRASASPAGPQEFPVRLPDGDSGVVSVTCTPVRDRTGQRVSSIVVTLDDVTERKRDELRLQLLAEAGELLARSLDVERTLDAMVRLSVPAFVDICLAELVGDDGAMVRVAARAADPSREEMLLRLLELERVSPDAGRPLVMRTGEAVVYDAIDDAVLTQAASSAEHLALLRELDPRSAVIVPITGRGQTFGALTFATLSPTRRLSGKDVELASELGRRAGLALANARLYEHEKSLATDLQRSLLPPTLPSVPGLDLGSEFHAGLEGLVVGGDFFDVFPCGDESWVMLIGDVCGKGAEAAVIAGRVRYSARAIAEGLSPAEVMARLNQLVLTEHPDRFCTMAFVVVTPSASSVTATVICAGHPAPVVVDPSGTVTPVECSGPLLGVLPEVRHREVQVTLEPDQALVLFTDGVLEARRDGVFFGRDGVTGALRRAAGQRAGGLARELAAAAVEHAGGTVQDDIAILVARAGTPPG